MIWYFLGGFATSLVPAFIVYAVWTFASAVNSIDTD